MNTHPVSKQFLDNFKFMPLANVWPVERWGEKLLGGDSGVVGWVRLKGLDHKEQEQRSFVAVLRPSGSQHWLYLIHQMVKILSHSLVV